ncbi:MAG: 16S rRNA pseudouridine(516) synthase, partial [Lentisphaeria bacterium]|nr:16S rRNA pseudouridine(516) synthase [Lentisphaeria bacterium]
DGDFAHRMTSPRKEVWKRYFARLDAPMEAADTEAFASGMDLGDFTAAPGRLILSQDPCEVYVEIREGKFHQVKRMCAKVGKNVLYLKRCAVGGVALDEKLEAGKCRELTEEEKESILQGTPVELA